MFGRALQAVVWQQGTLMMPQHLQHQDAHHRAHLAARLHAAAPRNIGVVHLQLDALALHEGTINIPSATVVMPRGEVLQWHEQDGHAPICRALPDSSSVPDQTVEIYLTLPAWRAEGGNVALCDHDADRRQGLTHPCRLVAEAHALPEISRGETPPVDVLLARPNARIAFGHELQANDCRLHIATVTRLPHGGAQAVQDFLPQSLRLQALSELVRRLTALHGAVRAAEHQARTQGGSHHGLVSEQLLRHRGLMQLHLALSDLLTDAYAAPVDVYRQLRVCLPWLPGSAQSVASLMHHDSRAFDDKRPGDALWPLVHALEQAVATAPTPLCVYPATQMAKSGLFVASVVPWPKHAHGSWYVRVTLTRKDGLPVDAKSRQLALQAWPKLAKVAAPGQMPRLIRSALRGIALTPIDDDTHPALAMPSRGNAGEQLLFALDSTDGAWPLVQQEGDIVLLPPPGGQDMALELSVLCLAPLGDSP